MCYCFFLQFMLLKEIHGLISLLHHLYLMYFSYIKIPFCTHIRIPLVIFFTYFYSFERERQRERDPFGWFSSRFGSKDPNTLMIISLFSVHISRKLDHEQMDSIPGPSAQHRRRYLGYTHHSRVFWFQSWLQSWPNILLGTFWKVSGDESVIRSLSLTWENWIMFPIHGCGLSHR